MSEFSEDELRLLHYMWQKRRFKVDRSRPEEAIVRDLGHKIENVMGTIKSLMDKGLLGVTKKKGSRRYWVNAGDTKGILMGHGRI